MMLRSAKLLAVLFFGCVEYDPELANLAPGDSDNVGVSVPCDNASEATIRVEEYSFTNVCGCLEGAQSEAKRCTVPIGTQVVWEFQGSLEHNVHSEGEFSSSTDRLRGRHQVTFSVAGEYPYECSIHAGVMSDYHVVVSP